MYKYLFGPVPSRRLGMSLGVDLVPHKVCSLDCVYCECGATTKLTTERMEYVPVDKVMIELEKYFESNPDPDFITFSGSGEPTLNIRLGEVIRFIKYKRPNVKVAVLTNGTLFANSQVRSELLLADLVVPSMDAATEDAFVNINRPEKGIVLEDYIDGLIKFRKEYTGLIWLELFFLKNYNDDDQNISVINSIVNKILPDKVQLNTLDRPGTIEDLSPMAKEDLEYISSQIDYSPVEIIASFKNIEKKIKYRDDIENAVVETIKRRPCTLQDLVEITGFISEEILYFLSSAQSENRIYTSKNNRGEFYHLMNKED